MLVEKPAQRPYKTSQNQPKKLQTSPKYAKTLAVCSESYHH